MRKKSTTSKIVLFAYGVRASAVIYFFMSKVTDLLRNKEFMK